MAFALARWLVVSAACAAGMASEAGATEDCGTQKLGQAVVKAALDGRTLALADGRIAVLEGIDIPPPPADGPPAETAEGRARAFLAAHAVGRTATLTAPAAAEDRYGRVRSFVYLPAEGLEALIQHAMLARGLARAAGLIGSRGCAAGFLSRERLARAGARGLWADAAHAVRQADRPAALLALRGHFALVEGRVVSVRESGATVYVNFGRRWSEDFTVTVAKRNARMLAAEGLDLKGLARRKIRVRGFIEERGGPWIEVVRPEQIEMVQN